MKQYLHSVHSVEGSPAPPPGTIKRAFEDVAAFNPELRSAGAWVFAGGLHPPSRATVVRVHDGDTLITDGPFAEGKEHIGGFWVIKARDLDAALKRAAKATPARAPPGEVRPVQEETQD